MKKAVFTTRLSLGTNEKLDEYVKISTFTSKNKAIDFLIDYAIDKILEQDGETLKNLVNKSK